MTAPNHALTGAAIGLMIANPWVALPLAFLSHFACDLIPHYDPPGTGAERINSKRFIYELLLFGAAGCFAVVLLLFLKQPAHWLQAAVCAFLAASPDLFWVPRFIHVKRTGKDVDMATSNWFWRFHSAIQWKTSQRLALLEAVWFVVFGAFLLTHL